MRQVGVTTVQRWLSEKVDWGVKSYMESDGTLYELSTVTGISGGIGVTLLSMFRPHPGRFFAGRDNYTLQSPVYLCSSTDDLTGLTVDNIELIELGNTVAGIGPGRAGGSRFNVAAPSLVACGDASEASLPHCG